MKTIIKTSFIGLGILSLSLFSGCSLDDIGGEKSWFSETQSNPNTMGEISDEAFEKAFNTYLTKNPVKFGKKVDEAYKIYQAKLNADKDKEKFAKAKTVRDISENDHIKGSTDPKFVLFEYSDYHCPYCKIFHPTTKQFLKNNDDVALVFRAYPAVHRKTSAPLHQIAECVATEEGNDAFWKFTDSVFEKGSSLTVKNIETEMKNLGFTNTDKIMKCYNDGTFTALVNESEKEAQSLGIDGTPGSILKNLKTGEVRVISGAYPLEALQSFKEELEK